MRKIFIIFALFLAKNVYSQSAPAPTASYANSIVLQKPDGYVLYWNFTKTDILFEVHVKTSGWAGFGLSPNGGMDGSNVAVFWIDKNGKMNFTDRHIVDKSVIINKAQNWYPISLTSKNGYLVAKFTRKIKICDKTGQDVDIPVGTPYTIFAYGNSFAANGDIAYHDFRGSKTLPLISSANSIVDVDMSSVQTADFRINTTIDNRFQTVYYCQVFKLPANWTQVKQHLIQYETLYTDQTRSHYHHWTMLECSPDFETVYLKNHSFPEPGNCVEDENQVVSWKDINQYCSKSSFAWAVGSSDIQKFPQDIAYPVEFKYFFLQIHFDNPNRIPNLQDNSGMRMYVTTDYRKTEFGIFTLASNEDYTVAILPPHVDTFGIDFSCHKNCTDNFFDDKNDEINIFSVAPHTHLTGKEVIVTQVRDNKEIGYIVNNKNFDFNYQYVNFLAEPIKFKKGDEMKLTCVYNTTSRSNFTYGGYGTRDEMCDAYLWYYPRNKYIDFCGQIISKSVISKFLDQLTQEGELAPVDMSNNPKMLNLNALKANNSNLVQKFRDFYAQSERLEGCSTKDGIKVFKSEPSNVVPMDEPACQTDSNLYYLSANTQ